MGMFDFFKKDNAEAEAAVTAEETKSTEMTRSRYTLMVEDAFTLKKKNGLVVVGHLHGEIKVGDAAYICHHTKPMTCVKVLGIEIEKGKPAQSASNQPVALLLDCVSTREEAPKFAVISGMEPQVDEGDNTKLQNPMLLGLSMEYMRFVKEEQYLHTLIYAATHAKYITPVKVDEQSAVSFVGIGNPSVPGVTFLPLFTDWVALNIDESVFESNKKDTMLMEFPDAVSVAKNGYEGIVINPYGPVPVMMPGELINAITSLEGYKDEFGE
ncbi:MAG: SseB family protein [Lachnospira sp.]|nr:SseB family protein [Lachnospira sp.]